MSPRVLMPKVSVAAAPGTSNVANPPFDSRKPWVEPSDAVYNPTMSPWELTPQAWVPVAPGKSIGVKERPSAKNLWCGGVLEGQRERQRGHARPHVTASRFGSHMFLLSR